jgi:hypothetical protein
MKILLLFLTFVIPAFNQQDGQYDHIPQHLRDWFNAQRSPHGVPCCNIADGHLVQDDIRVDSYWAFFENEWRQIPPEAIIYGSKNPNGMAVVWYVRQGVNTYYVRCFVPGSST